MTLRAKLLLTFIAFGLVPMILMCVVNYLSGSRTTERLLREDTQARVARVARRVENTIRAHEAHLSAWANSPDTRSYLRTASAPGAARPDGKGANSSSVAPARDDGARKIPEKVRSGATDFLVSNHKHFEALTLLKGEDGALFRLEALHAGDGHTEARFITEDIPLSAVRADKRVWTTTDTGPLRAAITHEQYGSCIRFTIPVFPDDETRSVVGALVAEMKLGPLFEESVEAQPVAAEGPAGAGAPISPVTSSVNPERIALALDNATGNTIYNTSDALRTPISEAMPFFKDVAAKMTSAPAGLEFYDAPNGDNWLAAFKQVQGLGVSVAVARNYSAAAASVRHAGLLSLSLTLFCGLSAIAVLSLIAQRATRRIERVAEGAAAIADGNLNQHIEIHSTDDTHVLAESFNRMSDRLREHIARETESRQFESFVRLSAMLTHDLKNSITGLSILVNNMEKQFHREEFRADAILSLREATDKLRRIVSRLSEPLKSLSGEYRRAAKETDLVPIIKRVLAVNAEPSVPLYEIETHLPETLVATVEPERIENVIENLIINALEAMGAKGGRLTVEAGALPDGHIFFNVADTGVGMSEEFLRSRLYHPFTTTKTKGIGLGLFTCREIVETHGGRIEVDSQLGVGTRFRVVLPSSLFSSRDHQKQPSKGTFRTSSSSRG